MACSRGWRRKSALGVNLVWGREWKLLKGRARSILFHSDWLTRRGECVAGGQGLSVKAGSWVFGILGNPLLRKSKFAM